MVPPGLQNFTSTPGVPLASPGLKLSSLPGICTIKRHNFTQAFTQQATNILGPIIAVTTWAADITAAAGTRLTQPLLSLHLNKETAYT